MLTLWLMITAAASSQELRLIVFEKPLNALLNTLNVEISYDDKALSEYKVSVSKTFKNPTEAIEYLLKDKPFKVEKMGNVYVISPVEVPPVKENPMPVAPPKYYFRGELSDRSSGELLPYAYIQTDKGVVPTNELGYFSIVRESNEPLRIEANYMGFEKLDTTLNAGNHKLSLIPKAIVLEEVIVSPSPASMLMQSGKTSGEIRLNHQIAKYMPGSADNSVFNLLRMIPGVRASGEPSEDLFVWGSNWGESRLQYDGFTIFGMKSFNDQIGSVNPYLVKDIRLSKSGYEAPEGNRIGAIAEIIGNDGNFVRPSVKANLSNYTANVFASLPLKQSAALSVAYRQTFYNLYRQGSIENSNSAIYIEPEYDFRDLNIKLAGRAFGNDHYHISLYGADDHFQFSVKRQDYEVDADEKNRQYGAAANYNRVWASGSHTQLLASYSRLSADIDNVSGITNAQSAPLDIFFVKNIVQEFSLKLEHNFHIGQRQKLQLGGEWKRYTTSRNHEETNISNPALFLTDDVSLGKLSIKAGIRADFIPDEKVYLQPRLSARYAVTDELSATASFGLYNQFLTRIPYQYREGSYQMIWNLSDSVYLSSIHYQAGLAYSRNGWLLSAEGYVRKSKNQLYFIDNDVSLLDNTNTGADFFIKKEWRENTAFASYSIVGTNRPQQSTGHEIKLGAVYSIKPFYLSTTYIYGTGYSYLSTSGHGHGNKKQQHAGDHAHGDTSSESYSRLDVSLLYKLQINKIRMQAGVSLLNVFDTNNVKYSYRLSNQNNVYNVYTKATPLTPIAFFEIIF